MKMNLPEEGFWILGLNNPSIDNLTYQEMYFNRCLINPLLCNIELENRCSAYTKEDLKNSTIRKFCSCYLNDDEYSIERECDSLCSRIEVVPYVKDRNVLRCQRDVCIIDSVTLTSVGNTISDVNFNQVCNNCTSGACLCIINDLTYENVRNLNINQNCSATICNSGGYEISCNTLTEEKDSYFFISILVLSVIGIVAAVIAFH